MPAKGKKIINCIGNGKDEIISKKGETDSIFLGERELRRHPREGGKICSGAYLRRVLSIRAGPPSPGAAKNPGETSSFAEERFAF